MDQLLADIYAMALLSGLDPDTLTPEWSPTLNDDSIKREYEQRLRELLDEYGSANVQT